ncbi:protein of unknown function [Denitratisoma oestradiolicum]|uniref:Uncharacterized protein n=1 Tax=Denitratisoma oestradiolicum TaxID=311182 RepID=A0A6S6XVC8_9PROT|nr:protein of unknown function [Denitratisoma oestradiolicum]
MEPLHGGCRRLSQRGKVAPEPSAIIERSEPMGSPAPGRGWEWGAFNLPLRIFILGGGPGDHVR